MNEGNAVFTGDQNLISVRFQGSVMHVSAQILDFYKHILGKGVFKLVNRSMDKGLSELKKKNKKTVSLYLELGKKTCLAFLWQETVLPSDVAFLSLA